jgi:ketosteroid isomerase-like protein
MMKAETRQAEQLFRKFCKGYKERDLATLLSLFTKNTNMWGTGLDEYRVGIKQVEEQLKRDWSQSEKGEIEITSFVPAPEDSTWAAAVCTGKVTIDGHQHVFEHLRGTIIIEKENGVWKISHMHASFPDFRNPENGSFPLNEA